MDAEQRFEDIADDLAPRGVLPGALFGSRSLTLEGTAFVSFKGDRFAVKLGASTSAHAEALTLDGAELFDPSGNGRPFKDWVVLPDVLADEWPRFAEQGLAALTAGPA